MCRLLKTLYGLKQYLSSWFERINYYLINIGFKSVDANQNVYIKHEGSLFILLGLYVDDCVVMKNDITLLEKTKLDFTSEFHMIDVVLFSIVLGYILHTIEKID